ncbi:DUF2130 domain-containing protein [Aromatoleum evansii]|uniref:DUF2130 domain-containing protein n=1 Tax=Aromatoleum evansii TaxID=59406 RepID=UPI00145EC7D3|nr:DUF2130 domain-containing protein [Aromatoleum evansii]NMG31088.1 DUF2130 domain-containing protein [Aromatoleum evansii]
MPDNIIIAASEEIVCPKCGHHYPLELGITRQTIERYAAEFDAALGLRRQELEKSLFKEADRRAKLTYDKQLKTISDQLLAAQRSEEAARRRVAEAHEEGKARALADFDTERLLLTRELAAKDEKLKEFRAQELSLRQERKQLEDAREALALELNRKLDLERARIREEIGQRQAQRIAMIEGEYKKKIEDAQRANEDLRRKLEQGSQQLQGEVLELELEDVLAGAFPHDSVAGVKKGQRGADVLQTVRTPSGRECGRIVWEAKRAGNWSEKWLQKLKDDRKQTGAEISVLVTTTMPRGLEQPFGRVSEVWITPPHLVLPLAETLRVILLEVSRVAQMNTCRGERVELLFQYLASPRFVQQVAATMDSFSRMRMDLEAEKRAIQKIWSKRDAELVRVATSMSAVIGELQAIAQESLPGLEAIDSLHRLAAVAE